MKIPNLEKLDAQTRELAQIRYALDHSAIVAVTDRAGQIIHVNDKFCKISGYSREELLGQNHRMINSGHHGKAFFEEMWKAISSGESWEGEIRNRAKDGSFYWVYTTIVPSLDQNGKPEQYVSIRFEITQRKLAEEQLRNYAGSLEASNREIRDLALQDRLASVGMLASSLAHEIGTPLGVIRGRAEYLGIQVKDDPAIKKNVEVIVSQIDRVSKLIRSLLNLARGEQAKYVDKISFNEVASEVLELLGHELRKHGIEVQNRIPAGVEIWVKGKPEPLHQVLLNLLINSMHAIESAVKKGRATGHFIRLEALQANGGWEISVVDSGCGISQENLKHLFKPFFTTKDIGVGTGLGLATSYRILESWGGSIQVKSEEGKGSSFTMTLPSK